MFRKEVQDQGVMCLDDEWMKGRMGEGGRKVWVCVVYEEGKLAAGRGFSDPLIRWSVSLI